MVFILLGGIFIILGAAVFSPIAVSSNLHPMFLPATGNFIKGFFAQIVAVLVTGPQSFVGFDTVPQFIEETNFSSNKIKVSL